MWFWDKKKYKEKKKLRNEEMKKSLKVLGVKKFFKQDNPTRKLKENIETTFRKINLLIKDHKIDTLFCPAYEGGHQDLDVSNFICSRLRKSSKVYEYAEYNFSKGQINCNEFINPTKNEVIIKHSENEKKEKIKLLEIYNSEKNNLDYLNKRAVFVYLREISGLNSSELSSSLSNIRKIYRKVVGPDNMFDLFS